MEIITSLFGFAVMFGFPLLVVALVVVAAIYTRQKQVRGWSDFAARTGMLFKDGGLLGGSTLGGEFRGRPARVWTYSVRSGRNSTRYTAMALGVANSNGYTVSVKPASVFSAMGRAITGTQEVQVGDEAFDKRYEIRSNPTSLAGQVFGMDGSLREAIQRTPAVGVEVQGGELVYRQRGTETNPDKLFAVVEVLDRIAERFEEQSGGRVREGFGALPADEDAPQESPAEEVSIWGKKEFSSEDEFGGKAEYGAGDVHDSWSDDPFYQKKPIPQQPDPFGPPPTAQGPNMKLLLIGVFVAFDLAIGAAILAYFLFFAK